MPVPAFGYSLGDIIASITFISSVISALRSGEAASEFALIHEELSKIFDVLETIQLSTAVFQSQNLCNRIVSLTESLAVPLDAFREQLKQYESVLGVGADPLTWRKMLHKSGWIIGGKKVKWNMGMRNDIFAIRAVIATHQGSISLLLNVALGSSSHFAFRPGSVLNIGAGNWSTTVSKI